MGKVPRNRPGAASTLQPEVEPINTGGSTATSETPARPRPREEPWEQLGTYVPSDVARALRMHAAADRVEIRDVVTAALRAYPDLAPYLTSKQDSQNAS
ncbi:hypothetical protein [Halostreptopolyspora alba]|uniref:Uncharacterized protein n=1 Tax=Halostreptopolyspora alba TaxID=2487137 RepID=A0A3N0DZ05_9ACTN|nr:hypothetical protein EFW17_22530 [Nocardiopsaceae bacterium YIM 96095]